ncbi:MAG: MoxR family ATPase [Methanoregula sp.]|nr:MoxR family ATPase [Methanoregula sp.]
MSEQNTVEATIGQVEEYYQKTQDTLGKFIVGNRQVLDIVLTAIFANGHVLIEGVPGTAKTSIAKSIAHISGCRFNRIQGAVDLQPADMLGVWIYDSTNKKFIPRFGPIFTNILLVDEINRINPKAQSAFIEAMSERQVTLDGVNTPLPSPFFVIATQNPHEFEGTFPLIEVQRDRFMFSLHTSHLESEEELTIVRRASGGQLSLNEFESHIPPILDKTRLETMIRAVQAVRIEEPVLEYIRDLVISARNHPDIDLGPSSRASIAFVYGSRVQAAFSGRTYVIPDDVKVLVPYVFEHRINLTLGAKTEGVTTSEVVREIIENTEVP